jgi:hypothetical protein
MYCRICGANPAKYRAAKRQTLCAYCNRETPAKVARESFDAAYWKGCDDVPESTRREFYADYLASTETLRTYMKSTTTEIGY